MNTLSRWFLKWSLARAERTLGIDAIVTRDSLDALEEAYNEWGYLEANGDMIDEILELRARLEAIRTEHLAVIVQQKMIDNPTLS